MLLTEKPKPREIPYFSISIGMLGFIIVALAFAFSNDPFTDWCLRDSCTVKKECYNGKKYLITFCPKVCGMNSTKYVDESCLNSRFMACLGNCYRLKEPRFTEYLFYLIGVMIMGVAVAMYPKKTGKRKTN